MNVYLFKRGNLNNTTNKFEFYEDEIFSSCKKATDHINKMVEVNNGYNRTDSTEYIGGKAYIEVTYNCMSAPLSYGVEAKEMRIRYCLYKKEVK